MSSRQLRKLQKQRELQEASNSQKYEAQESSEDEDPSPAPAAKPRVSLFAALGGDGDDQDQDDDQEDDEPVKSEEESIPQPAQSAKKSKKKKKKKNKAKAAAVVEEEEEPDEDEIDKAMKELNLTTQQRGADGVETASPPTRRINELLSINTYHLKAINEMRNLFGRDVIESANAEEEAESQRRRGGGRAPAQRQVDLETFLRGPPGAKKLPEVSLRRNVFIQGREHWPRATAGGLTMKTLGPTGDGGVEYVYEHDAQYDAVQAFFFSCVGIGDPMRIVYLLQQVRKSFDLPLSVKHTDCNPQHIMYRRCFRSARWQSRTRTWHYRQSCANEPFSPLEGWQHPLFVRTWSTEEPVSSFDAQRIANYG